MDSSQLGIWAGLVYAAGMFTGVWLETIWLAKLRPMLHKEQTMTFKELQKRIRYER